MTIATVLLMILGMPFQDSSLHSRSSAPDSTRVAIAKAALEHAVFAAKEEMGVDAERMFLDPQPGGTDRIDPSEWAGGDTAAFVAVAEQHDIEVRDILEHPAWLACHQERRSEPCRASRGATKLSVGRVVVLGPEHAFAWISIRIIADKDGNRDSTRHQQLDLEKVEDTWRVVGVAQTIDF